VPVWKSARRSRRKGALTMGLSPRREAYTPSAGGGSWLQLPAFMRTRSRPAILARRRLCPMTRS
jgi:hypothetical protein